jgi:hypothetical protein
VVVVAVAVVIVVVAAAAVILLIQGSLHFLWTRVYLDAALCFQFLLIITRSKTSDNEQLANLIHKVRAREI